MQVPQRMSGSFKIWSFPGKIARDIEPALRAAPQVFYPPSPEPDLCAGTGNRILTGILLQHGKEAWTWKAYTVPEGLASAKLPKSANRDKWKKRYGSLVAQRGKQAAADKALESGEWPETTVEHWMPPASASAGAFKVRWCALPAPVAVAGCGPSRTCIS